MEEFYLKQAETNKPLDINMIDFDFVQSCDKLARLKKALKILEDDGDHFPDLQRELKAKILKLDPKYLSRQN